MESLLWPERGLFGWPKSGGEATNALLGEAEADCPDDGYINTVRDCQSEASFRTGQAQNSGEIMDEVVCLLKCFGELQDVFD
jgi:hypothetical protein